MKKVRKAVITAAGRGTRLYPATQSVRKPMFPLVDADGFAKPVVQIVVEEALGAGVEQICVVISPGDEEIYRNHFSGLSAEDVAAFQRKPRMLEMSERLAEMSKALSFVTQTSPEGYGHAVYQARDFVGDEPFLLMLGDHVYTTKQEIRCAAQLCDRFVCSDALAMTAVQITPAVELHLFGALRGAPVGEGIYQAEHIIEKPSEEYAAEHLVTPDLSEGMYLCHFGMHVFPAAIFDTLEYFIENDMRENSEIQLTNAQERLRERLPSGAYACCTIDGTRHDTGNPQGLIDTQLALATDFRVGNRNCGSETA
jgi:UTP--glucose-1-phosphate uridylyltransferase